MEPTEAADCWSFGSLLYELLTGVVRSRGAVHRVGGEGGGDAIAQELPAVQGALPLLAPQHCARLLQACDSWCLCMVSGGQGPRF